MLQQRERVTERLTQRQREGGGGAGGTNKETDTQRERETERDRDRASNLLATTAAVLRVLVAGNARQNTVGQYAHLSTSTRTFMPSILILRLWTTVTFLKYVRYCHLVTDYSVQSSSRFQGGMVTAQKRYNRISDQSHVHEFLFYTVSLPEKFTRES